MWFFRTRTISSIAVIDIQSASVGVAYVYFSNDGVRSMCYSLRVPLEHRAGESEEAALERALHAALAQLATEGSPILHQHTGSGRVDRVIVSVSAPWQETVVQSYTETYPRPRTISKVMLEISTRDARALKEGSELIDEVILSVSLNGYEIPVPFGKQASRVEFTVLTSYMSKTLHATIHEQVRKTFHMHETSLISFAPVVFVALRDMYPFEKDFIVLSVSDTATDVAQSRANVLVATGTIPHGVCNFLEAGRVAERSAIQSIEDEGPETLTDLRNPLRNAVFATQPRTLEQEWIEEVKTLLEGFSRTIFLPKTVFLIAESGARDYIARTLLHSSARELWITSTGPTIIPLTPGALEKHIHFEQTKPDISLAMISLYDEKRFSAFGE